VPPAADQHQPGHGEQRERGSRSAGDDDDQLRVGLDRRPQPRCHPCAALAGAGECLADVLGDALGSRWIVLGDRRDGGGEAGVEIDAEQSELLVGRPCGGRRGAHIEHPVDGRTESGQPWLEGTEVVPVGGRPECPLPRHTRSESPVTRFEDVEGPRGRSPRVNCYYGRSANSPSGNPDRTEESPMTSFDLDLTKYQLGWSDEVEYAFDPVKGINPGVVEQISWWKGEPRWMTQMRQRSLRLFDRKPMAEWFAVNMPDIDFQDIYYYLRPSGEQVDDWNDLPEQMKATYEKLGIPEAERQYLSGVTAQFESEVVYHRNRVELEAQGILFCDMDTALREYPDLVKQYFGTIIPPGDNKFAALNTSVWSGGSFIYVPPGVECEMPLQAYFRINAENAGQFERTLIIADEGSQVHYIEGCSAPVYTSDSLHSAVVEIVVKPSARVTYTTIQNWSPNVYNLVTKRARVEAEGHMEWIDGNIGSKLTMKYPSVYLVGPKATGEVLSVAYAGAGQHQDAGAKMIHAAPETTSKIVSKSISKDGGKTTYRGLVRVDEGAHGCKSHVQCDALILDDDSESWTLPYMEVGERDAQIGHEATVSKVADEQLFYLMSRGLSEEQAMGMVVNGFIEPITRTLPMEYAVEWSRLIELQMEGSVG